MFGAMAFRMAGCLVPNKANKHALVLSVGRLWRH